VYAPSDATAGRLVWVSRQGTESAASDISRNFIGLRLSPDDRRIAVVSEGAVWLQDTARPVFTRLTQPEPNTGWPVWTPNGQRILYRSVSGIHWIQTDGSGRKGIVGDTSEQDIPTSVSPDGEWLLFVRISPETGSDIYVLSLRDDPHPRPIVNSTAYEGGPQFSPDGRWIAYASDESGSFQIYLRPFPGPDRRVQVSTDGGTHPLWNRKGHELFYRNKDKMMAVDVATGSLDADPVLSSPRVLFDQRYRFVGNTIASYDVSVDGQRFAFIKPESKANRLNLVINWFEELKARVPTK
jgi:Tol biopolymer transport system component